MTTQSIDDGTASDKEKLPAIVEGVQLLLKSLRADLHRRIDDELTHCDLSEFEQPPSLEISEKLVEVLKEELEAFDDFLANQEWNFEQQQWHMEQGEIMIRLEELKALWRKLLIEGHDPDRLPLDAEIPWNVQFVEIREIVREVGETRPKK